MEWKSLRNSWPELPGRYKVKDFPHGWEGETEFDGRDFAHWRPTNIGRGSLFLYDARETHWKEIEEENETRN